MDNRHDTFLGRCLGAPYVGLVRDAQGRVTAEGDHCELPQRPELYFALRVNGRMVIGRSVLPHR